VAEQDQWDDVIAWMVNVQERLRSAVALTGGLPTGLPPAGWSLANETTDAATSTVTD
jgi:hypothetical protein